MRIKKYLAPGIYNWIEVPNKDQCTHLGVDTGETVVCAEGCRGVKLKVFECGVFGACTLAKRGDGVAACCRGCPKFTTENAGHRALKEAGAMHAETVPAPHPPRKALEWAYGVTTVQRRLADGTLARTLSSLRLAGFDRPRLFVDGAPPSAEWLSLGCEVTHHDTTVRTFGNWVLGMWELYLRQPQADRYAMFQDDMVTYRSLRAYLDQSPYPSNGYLNLYTMPSNQSLAPSGSSGWYRARLLQCPKCHNNDQRQDQPVMCCGERRFQTGRGAVALVFDRAALQAVLSSMHMVQRPTDPMRGHCAIDGGISWGMNKQGFFEYVHSPSLVQHTGTSSTMGNNPHPSAPSFRGEEFDAARLLHVSA